MSSFRNIRRQEGYIVLITVLLLGAVGTLIASSVLFLGTETLQTEMAFSEGAHARAMANACAEHGLNQLRQNTSYSGGETLSLGNDSCEVIAVLGSGGSNRTLQAEGISGDAIFRIEISVQTVDPIILLSSWQEVDSF